MRSTQEVSGYSISASDDNVGHAEDFLFDDETWSVRFLVVDTGVWLLGRHVLVNHDCVLEVDWGGRCVKVSQTREQINQGSEFDANDPPPGDYETALKQAVVPQPLDT